MPDTTTPPASPTALPHPAREAMIHVLLVEDNPNDALLIRELLQQLHPPARFQLVHADRLETALDRLTTGGIDVILLDLSLPDGHGLVTLARANAAAPDVPIVVLTGHDDTGQAIQALQEGAQDYLVKGQVDSGLIERALRYAIERKRLMIEQARRAEAEASARRSWFVAEASRALSATLDYEATLKTVVGQAVPTLADVCVLDTVDDTGQFERVAATCSQALPEHVANSLARAAQLRRADESPLLQIFRTGQTLFLTSIPDELLEALAFAPDQITAIQRLALNRYFGVPMMARGRTIGILSLLSSAGRHGSDDEERILAEELAGRAALAIDNARLYQEAQQLIGVVSHDLRNPLSVIAMSLASLRHYRSRMDERQIGNLLDKMHGSAERMSHLIRDLLDLNRMEAGHLNPSAEPLAVDRLLTDVHDTFRPLAEQRSLQLEVISPVEAPPIRADRERAFQLFSNIIGNAIKFTPAGGRITITIQTQGEELCFCVRDTGPGIPEHDLARIFDRYWQASRTDRQGAGLGLAIARRITQSHGGRIWAESTAGKGSAFYFTLPLA